MYLQVLLFNHFTKWFMQNSNILISKIFNAVDSDELQSIALNVECNLPKEKMDKLKIMLKDAIYSNSINQENAFRIKQFLSFI